MLHKLEKRFFKFFGITAEKCGEYDRNEQCCNSEYCWNGLCNSGVNGKKRLPISNFIFRLPTLLYVLKKRFKR